MGKKKNSTVLIKRTQNTRKTNFKKLMKCKLVTQKCLEKLKKCNNSCQRCSRKIGTLKSKNTKKIVSFYIAWLRV